MICYQTWPLELSASEFTVGRWGICRLERSQDGGAFLTGSERERAESFRCRLRRAEWLGARAGLRRMLQEAGIAPRPSECNITKDRRGKPLVDIGGAGGAKRVDGSLAHKDGLAGFAAVWDPTVKIGIDLEAVSTKPWRCRRAFATRGDYLLDSESSDSYYCVLWCCKEAASKALGKGLLIDFRELVISESASGRFTVGGNGRDLMAGRYLLFDGMVAAVVMMSHAAGCGRRDRSVRTGRGGNRGEEKFNGA
ncbi:MAG: hypothetical protein COT06_06730 [Syntrophobacteraceae bacterium CG07_land_8_20_14_0_80_61_8]|nr:MAG: hypothetical protein COT06_06730 [Syntrophobacteraceae bacterium CG07_land_8_20_14_0_80_61_8]